MTSWRRSRWWPPTSTAAHSRTAALRPRVALGKGWRVSAIGHPDEVDRGLAWERGEIRSEGRSDARSKLGAPRDRFGVDLGILLALHRCYIGRTLVRYWCCIGLAAKPHWYCIDVALMLHWYGSCIGIVLHLRCAGTELVLHVYYIGTALALSWHCAAIAVRLRTTPVLLWYCKGGTVPVLHCSVLVLFWYSMCHALGLCWYYAGLYWAGTAVVRHFGIVRVLHWYCAGTPLALPNRHSHDTRGAPALLAHYGN